MSSAFRNAQRLRARAAAREQSGKRDEVGGGRAKAKTQRRRGNRVAEERRLDKERAAAERLGRERRRDRYREWDRLLKQRALEEQRAWDREHGQAAPPPAELDDSRYRPQPPDSLLTGAARVTGVTARVVQRSRTITRFQWQAMQNGDPAADVRDNCHRVRPS